MSEGFSSGKISFEDYLDQHGTLTYTNVGVSMMPLLREGKDLFIVRKKGSERAKAGDVVLYRRPPDQYVLHRVIKVCPEDYVILGDNCVRREYGIRDEDILGTMSGFVRGGKTHDVTEPLYRAYTWVILHTIGIRICLKWAFGLARRIVKKVLRQFR